jgi:hypothetical protein
MSRALRWSKSDTDLYKKTEPSCRIRSSVRLWREIKKNLKDLKATELTPGLRDLC